MEGFKEWQDKVVDLTVKKQKQPFANYLKNRWKLNGRILKSLFKEGYSPERAVNLWALNHEKHS